MSHLNAAEYHWTPEYSDISSEVPSIYNAPTASNFALLHKIDTPYIVSLSDDHFTASFQNPERQNIDFYAPNATSITGLKAFDLDYNRSDDIVIKYDNGDIQSYTVYYSEAMSAGRKRGFYELFVKLSAVSAESNGDIAFTDLNGDGYGEMLHIDPNNKITYRSFGQWSLIKDDQINEAKIPKDWRQVRTKSEFKAWIFLGVIVESTEYAVEYFKPLLGSDGEKEADRSFTTISDYDDLTPTGYKNAILKEVGIFELMQTYIDFQQWYR
ncbi:hypothetical protein [Vibrio harveyi]|uniref:hypothetical protein n=1 Tax=Vibrio harveyi TaxID=669 RepID=UPI003CF3F0F1